MIYKILADLVVFVHFLWIVFMLLGFILTVRGFFYKSFFDRWIFRTIHVMGIAYVSTLAAVGKYCPLTLWENTLRSQYDPSLVYPGSFMINYIERFIYPGINPLFIRIPTTFIAVFTLVVFIIKPPEKVKKLFVK